jgi:hypothetical protein
MLFSAYDSQQAGQLKRRRSHLLIAPVISFIQLVLMSVFSPPLASASLSGGALHHDLSIGVVYPSSNQSILINPAALGEQFHPGFIDLSFLISGFPPGIEASYVRNVGIAGFGGGVTYDSGLFNFLLGVGSSVGPFEFGVNARSNSVVFFPPSIGLGVRVGDPSRVQAALTLDELINSNRNFTGGVAFILGRALRLELDLGPRFGYGFVFSDVVGSLGLLFSPTPDFSLHFKNEFRIIPDWNLSSRGVEVGLAYWFTKSFGLYGVYNDSRALFVVGAKINY